MAGLWDRVRNGAGDRVESLSLYAAMTLYAEGEVNGAVLLNYLNSRIDTPLSGAELTDIVAIRNKLDALPTVLLKHQWINLFHAALLFAENDRTGVLTEAAWRTRLGL